MAAVAESAVLVSSAGATAAVTKLKKIEGPSSHFDKPQQVLGYLPVMGFQASHFGTACHIAERMLRPQSPSTIYQIKDGKYILVPAQHEEKEDSKVEENTRASATAKKKKKKNSEPLIHPVLFLGITANLLGTGCREAVRFLIQEGVVPRPVDPITGTVLSTALEDASEDQLLFAGLKKEYADTYGVPALAEETTSAAPLPVFRSFLSAVVISGGGVEHDVRRACASYPVRHYASEQQDAHACSQKTLPTGGGRQGMASFGNVQYPLRGCDSSALFDDVMHRFVNRLTARQERLRLVAAARPVPVQYEDVCSWSVTPSEVWALLGLWLVDLLTEALHAQTHFSSLSTEGTTTGCMECAECRASALTKARTTVVYWAALQQVPLFSPSFADGDVAAYLLDAASTNDAPLLQLDLVRDIHAINKLAMHSKKTGMLICGGGVVKHHVCNANLMRNGADYTIILNNGQEFDGSDAGAKPEEALSWGKVRMEGAFVKVYGEVTTYLPLLVAQVFVPAVRRRRQRGVPMPEGAVNEETGPVAHRHRRPRHRQRTHKAVQNDGQEENVAVTHE